MAKFLFTNLDEDGKFIKITLDEASKSNITYELLQVGLIVPKPTKRFTGYEFKPELTQFFASLGYTSPLTVVSNLKKEGLIVPKDYAILFKIQFL